MDFRVISRSSPTHHRTLYAPLPHARCPRSARDRVAKNDPCFFCRELPATEGTFARLSRQFSCPHLFSAPCSFQPRSSCVSTGADCGRCCCCCFFSFCFFFAYFPSLRTSYISISASYQLLYCAYLNSTSRIVFAKPPAADRPTHKHTVS